jgi:hypothetical protein
MKASPLNWVFLCFGCLSVVGCSAPTQPTEPDPRGLEMFALGRAFYRYCQENARPPERPEDLVGRFSETPEGKAAFDRLLIGDIVFLFGVSQTDMQRQAGTSVTVLAFERQVPKEGGWVLMGDTGVRRMTPREFEEAPKAVKVGAGDACSPFSLPQRPTLTRPKLDS